MEGRTASLCVLCTRPALDEIEVAAGIWAGLCPQHLAERAAKVAAHAAPPRRRRPRPTSHTP